MKKELVKLANHLDQIGHRDLADDIDSILNKYAEEGEEWGANFEELMSAIDNLPGEESESEEEFPLEEIPEEEYVDTLSGEDEEEFAPEEESVLEEEFAFASDSSKGLKKTAASKPDLSSLFVSESSFYGSK